MQTPQQLRELHKLIKEFDQQLGQDKKIKKVIHKPINHGTHYTQILLQPNGNLILGTFSKAHIPLNIRNKIIFIGDPWIDYKIILKENSISQLLVHYSGELDPKLQPYSLGFYRSEVEEISATFNDGFSQNCTRLFKDQQAEIHKADLNHAAICSDKLSMITLPTFKSCFEGRWLNQKVVDFYLDFVQLYLNLNQRTGRYKNIIINTCNSQDIFSSDIFVLGNFSKETWKKYQNQNNINIEDTQNRYIFATNVRKSHFVVFVLEWKANEYQPILIDSLPNQYLEANDEEKIIKQVFQLIVNKPIGSLRKQAAPAQQNAYDCGIHSIYNSIQVLRNLEDPVEKINFELKPNTISYFRRHLYQFMVNNYAHLLKYYQ